MEEQGAETPEEYVKPEIVDHGDLQELTAAAGSHFTDVPIGNPSSSSSFP